MKSFSWPWKSFWKILITAYLLTSLQWFCLFLFKRKGFACLSLLLSKWTARAALNVYMQLCSMSIYYTLTRSLTWILENLTSFKVNESRYKSIKKMLRRDNSLWFRKVNIDAINWEKLFDRFAGHKWCNMPWIVNLMLISENIFRWGFSPNLGKNLEICFSGLSWKIEKNSKRSGEYPEILKRGGTLCRPPWLAEEKHFRSQKV